MQIRQEFIWKKGFYKNETFSCSSYNDEQYIVLENIKIIFFACLADDAWTQQRNANKSNVEYLHI